MHGETRREQPRPPAAGIRKGPWQPEEDNALLDYVTKHGPHDWSSLRSKGLLPRTGKSCRLRWVNKLKPGLKTGCKFTAEEERIVIKLQERFGNKWAQIATFLRGRTDNDVKNFWSTRKKRLAKILQSSPQTRSHRSFDLEPIVSDPFWNVENTIPTALPCNPPCLDLIPFTEQCSDNQCSCKPYDGEDSSTAKMVSVVDSRTTQPPPPPLDHHLFDLPPLPEAQDLMLEFDDFPLLDHIACPSFQAMQAPEAPTFFDMDVGGNDSKIKHPETIESFFDEFPPDMFDYLEQLPVGHKGS